MKLGVFDSGIGGEAVAAALQVTFPEAVIQTVNDRQNVPYGNKSQETIITLTQRAIEPILSGRCDIIVIACNTATTLALPYLRRTYPRQKFIGIEPMIKTAARLTKTGIVAVCATPATLASERYHELIACYGEGVTIVEPDCSQWASWIENNTLNRDHVRQIVEDVCDRHGADVIVLGCTHYHWIKDLIIELANGRAQVIEPSEAIGRRVRQLLSH